MTTTEVLPQADAKDIVLACIEHLAQWPMPSAEAFRNAVLGGDGMLAINPMLDITEKAEADWLRDLIIEAIRDGQMVDFGFVPNEIMKIESLRSRTMYEAGDLPMPYDNWVALSSWEGGFCGYYFSTNPNNQREVFCLELYGVRIPNGSLSGQIRPVDIVLIYDIVRVEVRGVGDTLITPGKLIGGMPEDKVSIGGRAANVIDPLVTMLRMLADASIPVITRPAPDKLNRQREKQGKFPIPSHHVVETKDYISLFHATKSAKGAAKGGHHASPVAHSRRAHLRTLASGKVVHVRDTRVNWRSNEELHRLFYRVPKIS